MKSYKGYFLDIDGTVIRGRQAIQGAKEFLWHLSEQQIPFLYLTNNSTRTRQQVSEMLEDFSFPASLEHIYTASMAVKRYLQQEMFVAKAYVIGQEGLLSAVQEAGCTVTADQPDVVIVGRDEQFSYQKMTQACIAIQQGAQLIGTSADRAFPTERGFIPGSGALIAGIQAATGVEPLFIGKPERIMMKYALEYIGLAASDVLMVGDNLETDIAAGHQMHMDTWLVFTGVTTPEIANLSPIKATYETESLLQSFVG